MSEIRLSIVIPAHNEEDSLAGTIHALVGALSAESIPHEILVVDDHSTDGTADVLQQLSNQYPSVRRISNERPNGFGQAVHTGIDAFTGDAFCLVMADGSDDPRDVVRYYRKLLEGYECVFGSRFTAKSKVVNYPKHKLLLNRLANLFIRILFGLQYNDITNAFKCYRRNVIEGIRPILSNHFNLTVELPLKAIVRGFSYTVVPIHWYGRVHGVSKLRIQEMGSRYLFIVLYVLLERLLSRGDYVRADQAAPVAGSDTPAPSAVLRPGWAWLSVVIVAVVQMLFAYTYPLNHLGGDTPGYEHVLLNRTSDLLFAPGYMVLAGLPLRVDTLYDAAMKNLDGFRDLLQVGQHAFEVLCLAILLIALTRVYNRLTAFLAVLIAGTSARAMGSNSSVYPEWMQADLLVLAFSLAVLAFTTPATRLRKTILYVAAFGVFAWCVLVKFNSIVFLPGLLAFFLFEKVPWRRRATMLLAATLFAFANYAVFLVAFHEPATGTFALTRDRSWVLLAKLENVYGQKLPYPEGIATKRWLALSSMLPPTYNAGSVGIFMNVNSVSKEIREPMRKKVGYLLDADERILDETLRTHRLPETFRLGISSIPISYYVGLKESDDLGVQVFRESIRHAPARYFRSVWLDSLAECGYPTTEPTFPSPRSVTGVTERVVPAGRNWLRLEVGPSSPLGYNSKKPIIWEPGYRFFAVLEKLAMSRGRTVFFMALGAVLAIWHGLRYGWSLQSGIPIALALLLVGFDIFSHAVLAFRFKEWRLAYPVAAILLAITAGWGVRELIAAVGRVVSGRVPAKST
jgi:dolichol-phosphate mannosyltransferase